MVYTKKLFSTVAICENKFREELRKFKKLCNEKGIVAGTEPENAELQKILSEMSACLKMGKTILGMDCETFVGVVTEELNGAGFTEAELRTIGADQ